jgi:hypothetical protein
VHGARRSDAAHDRRPGDAAVEERGARERERPAARHAGDGEPVELESIGDRGNVACPARERTPRLRGGQSESRPVDVDQAGATRRGKSQIGMLLEARAGEPVEGENGPSRSIAALGTSDPPPVCELDQSSRGLQGRCHG